MKNNENKVRTKAVVYDSYFGNTEKPNAKNRENINLSRNKLIKGKILEVIVTSKDGTVKKESFDIEDIKRLEILIDGKLEH